MKTTLTTSQAAHELLEDEYAGWSYNGAFALVEFLDELGEDCDTEYELDTVALRCEFSEWSDAINCVGNYSFEPEGDDEEEKEESALNWLRDQTLVIEFNGGIIIQDF